MDQETNGLIHKVSNFSSLITVAFVVLLGDTARGIFFPILWRMVDSMGYTKIVLGYCVGLFSFGRLFASPFFGHLSDARGTSASLSISCAVVGIGATVFACICPSEPSHIYLLMLAQTLLGVGSGTLGVTRAYYAQHSSKDQRTVMLARLTAVQYMGFTVMPVLGGSLYLLGETIHNSGVRFVTPYNAPALFMIAMSIVAVLLMNYYYDKRTEAIEAKPSLGYSSVSTNDSDTSVNHPNSNPNPNFNPNPNPNPNPKIGLDLERQTDKPLEKEMPRFQVEMALCAMCALNFSTRGAIAVYETLGAAYAYQKYQLSTPTVGMLFSGFGFCGMLILLMFPFLVKRIDDVALISFGLSMMVCAPALLVNYGWYIPLPWFVCSVFLMYTVGYPVGNTAVIGAFSKISKSTRQGLLLGFFASAGSLARVMFPVMSGYISDACGPSAAFLVALATLAFSLFAVLWKSSTIRLMIRG